MKINTKFVRRKVFILAKAVQKQECNGSTAKMTLKAFFLHINVQENIKELNANKTKLIEELNLTVFDACIIIRAVTSESIRFFFIKLFKSSQANLSFST